MPSPRRDHNEVRNVLASIGAHEIYMDGALALVRTPSGVVEIARGHSYYWTAKGRVPLQKALKLYGHPIGRDKIRVAGHCGCPPPEAPWVDWFAPDGKKVMALKTKTECEEYVQRGREAADRGEEPSHIAEVGAKILAENYFSDNPAMDFDAKGYVDSYHIDSDLALKIFVDELKAS